MPDNKNKGIGQYKDRPGYFWGGLVGGAILGALVNKMQGKDVMRGAMWGGITGGLGSAFVGSGSTAAGTGWLDKMAPGMTKSLFTMGAGNPDLFGSTLGAAGAWMAGDPKKDQSKYESWKEEQEAKRRKKEEEAYKYWHTNPWATGGMVTSRPGYPGGGSATLEYTDPDLYTPTGEGRGPSSNPILQIPLGPEGSFSEEFEELDLASASDPMDEWNQMYENYLLEGGAPMPLPDFIEMMLSEGDFTPDYGAQGGYKTRPQYRHAGEVRDEEEMTRSQIAEAMLTKSQRGQMWQDEDEEQKRMMELVMMNAKLKQPTGTLSEDTITRSQQEAEMMGVNTGSEETVDRRYDFLRNQGIDAAKGMIGGDAPFQGTLDQSQRDDLEDYFARFNPMAFRAEGGIADLDMTKGGASNGPGTGTSDDIPAMLSDGEFVVTANAVKNLGGGDRMLGAKKMYQMMNQLDPNSQTPAQMSAVGTA